MQRTFRRPRARSNCETISEKVEGSTIASYLTTLRVDVGLFVLVRTCVPEMSIY